MRQEIAKQMKMREIIQKKFNQMEDQKSEVDVQRETLKAQIVGLEKGQGAQSQIYSIMTELNTTMSSTVIHRAVRTITVFNLFNYVVANHGSAYALKLIEILMRLILTN